MKTIYIISFYSDFRYFGSGEALLCSSCHMLKRRFQLSSFSLASEKPRVASQILYFMFLYSFADPHQFEADPDTTCHLDVDPDPTFYFNAGPNPRFQIKAQTFKKCSNRLIFHKFLVVICKLMRILITLMRIRIQLITFMRIRTYPTFQFDPAPQHRF